jgi:drug/metabolite transporter (DMT)-like permease
VQLFILVGLALLAFAGNSVLCRLALNHYNMDAASFTLVRLISGALMLYILVTLKGTALFQSRNSRQAITHQDWAKAFYLFLYASCFSFAYLLLDTASGALILFGCVQFTLMVYEILNGKKNNPVQWLGMGVAISGFIYWALPSAQPPSLMGALLMALSGVAWAFYTLAGKGSVQAGTDTAKNFILSMAFLALLLPSYWLIAPMNTTLTSLGLAFLSGALTSALGYWVWYMVLPKLSTLSAGVLQLSVPILAALGGIIWAGERLSAEFVIAGTLVLSGILLVILASKTATIQK